MISIDKVDSNTFMVNVTNGTATTHEVTVDSSYWSELTGEAVPPETLVERSFEFLLEREPNTSILPRFNLSTITRYFPEYESTIRERF